MHTENDIMSARDRVSEALARRAMTTLPDKECCENDSLLLASVYSPVQHWRNLYDAESGFGRGTIFKELDLPFLGSDKIGGNCYGR